MRNLIHTGGIAAFALAVGFAATASGQFADTRDHTGTVAQYSLSPSGAVEGLILTDGTEVLLPTGRRRRTRGRGCIPAIR